jgi:hypothetical protein
MFRTAQIFCIAGKKASRLASFGAISPMISAKEPYKYFVAVQYNQKLPDKYARWQYHIYEIQEIVNRNNR